MEEGKAYIIECQKAKKCELIFQLRNINDSSEVVVDQKIYSAQSCTNTIKSLLTHTQNKILEILKAKDISNTEIPITLTIDGVEVQSDVNCTEFMMKPRKNTVLKILKQSFEVIINVPLVRHLVLPPVIFINYSCQPFKCLLGSADNALSEFTWYTSLDGIEWTEVHNNFTYKPMSKDLNKYIKLKCIPRNAHSVGPAFEVTLQSTIMQMMAIPRCPFDDRHEYTKVQLACKDEIRIVSYNTLSNRYADISKFPYCSPQVLSIDYRKQLILKELLGYNADIICLQEVDSYIFTQYLKNKLSKRFQGLFHKKGDIIPEGLACFFNIKRFKLIDSRHFVLSAELANKSSFDKIGNLVRQCSSLNEWIMKQSTSLQVTILKSKKVDEILIVGNTHLFYHPDANLIRLLQLNIALDCITDIYNYYKRATRSRISVLFCGDFNSSPSAEVYEFATNGAITCDFPLDDGNEKSIQLSHPFKFVSAYGTPKYTNYTEDFKACIDYIFYNKNNFTLLNCVPLPDESVLASKVALPSDVFPSDHVALVVNLKWT